MNLSDLEITYLKKMVEKKIKRESRWYNKILYNLKYKFYIWLEKQKEKAPLKNLSKKR